MTPENEHSEEKNQRIIEKECGNCGLIVSYVKKSKKEAKDIFCPNCGGKIIAAKEPKKESKKIKQLEKGIKTLKEEKKKDNDTAPANLPENKLSFDAKKLIPLFILTILFIVFYVIGLFDVFSDILKNFLKGGIGEEAIEIITPSLLIFFFLCILFISYSYWIIKWIKIKELQHKKCIKGKVTNRYFWIRVVNYIITTVILITTFYWFKIGDIIIEVAEPLTKDLLEPEQASQFCPSFIFVVIVLIVICMIRINTMSVNKEFEVVKATPSQPNSAVTAMIFVIAIIVAIAILYGVGFFDLLADILTPTSNGNGSIIDEPYEAEEWYLYAPRAAYESGSAPYRSGPYSSYLQCQDVNEQYYYGNGRCSRTN